VADNAGFPNGRRVFDDVVSIELKAVAGALLGDVVKTYKPDAAAGLLFDVGSSEPKTVASLKPSDSPTLGLPLPRRPVGRLRQPGHASARMAG